MLPTPTGPAHSQPNMTDTAVAIPNHLFTVDGLAQYLSVSRATVYRLIERRCFPVYRVARRLRIRAEDVERFLESQLTPERYGGSTA